MEDVPKITEWITAIAAMLAFLVALSAMFAAWRAPRAAARFADDLRKQAQAAESKQQMRMWVFSMLMKCRKQLANQDAISALNLVDVAFMDEEPVRVALRSFNEASIEKPFEAVRLVERYHVLIEKIADAMGFQSKITSFDIRAGYYPEALSKLDEAAIADARRSSRGAPQRLCLFLIIRSKVERRAYRAPKIPHSQTRLSRPT